MKILLIIIVLTSCFSSCSKKVINDPANKIILNIHEVTPRGNLNGFFDIDWNSNISDANIILLEKGIKILFSHYNENINQGSILGEGKFAGYNSNFTLIFNENGFYSADVKYKELKSFSEYNILFTLLKEKYGEPDERENTDNSYIDIWEFENNSSIILSFNNNVSIFYRNELFIEIRKQNREKAIEEREIERENNINDL